MLVNRIANIAIRHYHVTYRDNAERAQLPESNAHGIWARHADILSLEDVSITPRSCNTREMIVLRDVKSSTSKQTNGTICNPLGCADR